GVVKEILFVVGSVSERVIVEPEEIRFFCFKSLAVADAVVVVVVVAEEEDAEAVDDAEFSAGALAEEAKAVELDTLVLPLNDADVDADADDDGIGAEVMEEDKVFGETGDLGVMCWYDAMYLASCCRNDLVMSQITVSMLESLSLECKVKTFSIDEGA
ncbi:hypothetical protein WICPIJ_003230, partial [Wickerhamomyces pijperi]